MNQPTTDQPVPPRYRIDHNPSHSTVGIDAVMTYAGGSYTEAYQKFRATDALEGEYVTMSQWNRRTCDYDVMHSKAATMHKKNPATPVIEKMTARPVTIKFGIHVSLEGDLDACVNHPPINVPVTLEAVLESMKNLCFIVETVAHLQGKERELLPQAETARSIIAALQPRVRR
jgi:hypothetical protein